MNIVIWVVQILLGLAFILAGIMKASQPREKLTERMTWVEDYSGPQVKLIGVVEVLGGLGLILPAWTGIAPILTPLAATGLAIVMVLAGLVHVRRKEFNGLPVNAVLFALAAFVAITRFGPYSY
jgi:uncharacterized membrane protein YphA (DoxX/SURF4 family)